MKIFLILIVALTSTLASRPSRAESESGEPAKPKIKYTEGKELNFEQLVIDGTLKRPELDVVTGDEKQGHNGLVRLRDDFLDMMAVDAGEKVP